MANIKDSVGLGIFDKSPAASRMSCWTVGAWKILTKGLTFTKKVYQSLKT